MNAIHTSLSICSGKHFQAQNTFKRHVTIEVTIKRLHVILLFYYEPFIHSIQVDADYNIRNKAPLSAECTGCRASPIYLNAMRTICGLFPHRNPLLLFKLGSSFRFEGHGHWLKPSAKNLKRLISSPGPNHHSGCGNPSAPLSSEALSLNKTKKTTSGLIFKTWLYVLVCYITDGKGPQSVV